MPRKIPTEDHIDVGCVRTRGLQNKHYKTHPLLATAHYFRTPTPRAEIRASKKNTFLDRNGYYKLQLFGSDPAEMASFLDGFLCGDKAHCRGAQPPSVALREAAGICNVPTPLRMDYYSLSLAMRQHSKISSIDKDEGLRKPMRTSSFNHHFFSRAPD